MKIFGNKYTSFTSQVDIVLPTKNNIILKKRLKLVKEGEDDQNPYKIVDLSVKLISNERCIKDHYYYEENAKYLFYQIIATTPFKSNNACMIILPKFENSWRYLESFDFDSNDVNIPVLLNDHYYPLHKVDGDNVTYFTVDGTECTFFSIPLSREVLIDAKFNVNISLTLSNF